jgi:hypothetical protein
VEGAVRLQQASVAVAWSSYAPRIACAAGSPSVPANSFAQPEGSLALRTIALRCIELKVLSPLYRHLQILKSPPNPPTMSNKNNTAVQLSVIQSTTMVALTQTVSQVGVVSNGKIKSADISSTNKVGKKGKVVSTTTVSLKF